MEHYIYAHTRRSDGTVFYIGKGQKTLKGNPYARAYAYGKNSRSTFWHRYVAKYGPRDVTIDSVWATEEEAFAREIELIAVHRMRSEGGTLVNLHRGGPGDPGHLGRAKAIATNSTRVYPPVSQETRDKISQAKMGQPSPRKGVTLSAATKERISQAKTGVKIKPCSEERRRKVSEANKGQASWAKGIPKSPETRERMRQAALQRQAARRAAE